MVLGSKEVRVLLILSIFAKTISVFPSIFLSRHARQRSARQRQDLKRSARRLACLALKARDKETMVRCSTVSDSSVVLHSLPQI